MTDNEVNLTSQCLLIESQSPLDAGEKLVAGVKAKNVALLADEVSLRQRGIKRERLVEAVRPCSRDELLDLIMDKSDESSCQEMWQETAEKGRDWERRFRVQRLLRHRGLEDDEAPRPDPLADESLALAGISAASVQGRIALGRRAGARVWRLGHDPDAPWVASTGPRQAHLDGFDRHANLCVSATARTRLEPLCRDLLRPPVAQDRLRLTRDGRIRLELKRAWAAGTSHLLFEPLELLEKLAALTPRPRVNLVLYHGVLAPHARWRRRAVASEGPGVPERKPAADTAAPDGPELPGEPSANPPTGRGRT